MAFCVKCGTKLVEDALFCHRCGERVASKNNEESKRKCPSCGSPITPMTVICDYCGSQIENETSSSVQELCNKLEEIEANREVEHRSIWDPQANQPNRADSKKLTLIKAFPIPNDINEYTSLC